jgi:hypothetical protein
MKLVYVCALAALLSACRGNAGPPAASTPSERSGRSGTSGSAASRAALPDAPPAGQWFTDAAAASGLDFVHFNGMAGEFYYPEVMPPGVGLFDYDDDGDLDIFIVQGQMLGGKPLAQAVVAPPAYLKGRLFRNDLGQGGDGRLRFTDVTDASGIEQRGYGMGVATGDYDNDGCVDLFVTALGNAQLFRNNCNGTFADVTTAARAADRGWSVPAVFVDVDRDGWLDLFVGHYLQYSVGNNIHCYSITGATDYCPPHMYRAEPSRFLHNNGNGTFSDRTAAAGFSSEYGPALGVATADFNGDGWIDLHVSNDSTPNQLWINQRNGTFKNEALLAGTAVSPEGLAKASMGVDAGDFDNDGDEDLFIAELATQGADLYVNDGSGVFTDESARAGLRLATLPFTGFGTGWIDYDNDGWLDVLTVNGAVTHSVDALAGNEKFALQQRKQLFRNLGNGRFEDVTARAGAALQVADVSRGAAFGDIDNDGDLDVVVGNDSGPLRLLVNGVGNRQHWLGVRVVAAAGGKGTAAGRLRDMTGARVGLVRPGGRIVWRRSHSDGSYAAAQDPRVLFGLAGSADAATIRVVWPDGTTEQFSGVPTGRYTTLTQGSGT